MKNIIVSILTISAISSFAQDSLRPCGLSGSVQARTLNCSEKLRNYALVTRTKDGFEVLQDLKSGLLWSDRLPNKMDVLAALKICQSEINNISNLRRVRWRLPTKANYVTAEKNGLRGVTSSIGYEDYFWTRTLDQTSIFKSDYFAFSFNHGEFSGFRNEELSVRCIGQLY
jgi:hypothetical protein